MNRFLILILSLTLLFSCSIHRKTRKDIRQSVKKNEMNVDSVVNRMKSGEFDFNTLSLKFSAKYISKKEEQSFNGNIRIKKNEKIWISITPMLGIEAFRVLISQDSVQMIDRMNKTFFRGDYQIVNELLQTPFDFDMLQAFIIGNDFSYYENNSFKLGEDALMYRISTVGRRKLKSYIRNQSDKDKVFIQDIWIQPETYKIRTQQLKEISKQNNKLILNYSDFSVIGKYLFPQTINIDVESESKMSIGVSYTRVTVDEEISIPFVIPESYKPIKNDK